MFPNQSIRYKLAPQMRQYDSIKHFWKPFIMFFNEANIKSKVLNLDKFGLRFNDLNNLKNLDIETNNSIFNEKIFSQYKETAVLVGASTAFGSGASSDTFTIPSILSKKTNIHFFNFVFIFIFSKQTIGYEEDIKKVRVDIAELQKQVIDEAKVNDKHKKLHIFTNYMNFYKHLILSLYKNSYL